MRIHIQNPPNETIFPITPLQWAAAVARSPDMTGLRVSFASDDAGFDAAMPEAEALVTWTRIVHARFPKGALPAVAPKLRVISCTSAGLDRLAPFDWLPPEMVLLNNRGAHAAKAGEFGLMALLMLANHVPAFATAQRDGRWAPRFGSVLAGRSLCVIGLGSVGGAIAAQARHFGMRVTGIRSSATPHESCDEVVAQGDIDTVLSRAEFLVIACPLTPETRGLLHRARLALLPPGAKVVNMGRGALWDQDAICDMLEAGQLEGVVTDVTTPEPLPPEHRAWRVPNLFITPHMSSDDPVTYNDRTLDILFANLRAARDGQGWPNRVQPERGY